MGATVAEGPVLETENVDEGPAPSGVSRPPPDRRGHGRVRLR